MLNFYASNGKKSESFLVKEMDKNGPSGQDFSFGVPVLAASLLKCQSLDKQYCSFKWKKRKVKIKISRMKFVLNSIQNKIKSSPESLNFYFNRK